jgi:thioredoxin 1
MVKWRTLALVGGSMAGLFIAAVAAAAEQKALPKVVDFGDRFCIPCKLMAPALEELKAEQAGKLEVQFVSLGDKENLPLAEKQGIKLIPTQIFFNADGKEVWRHEGYISKHGILLKWKELGADLNPFGPTFKRLEAAAQDQRPRDKVCFMCDGDVDAKNMVTVPTEKGSVNLCSVHHFFVMLSCLQKDVEATEKAATIADAATGKMIPATTAHYLVGMDERTGRPTVKAFAARDEAKKARAVEGGSIIGYDVLKRKELAARCGFCDRSLYPEDAALVKIEGVHSWGCCAHCAMGCAARTGKDIEVCQPDALTGEPVIVKTMGGYVASIEPKTAVAWFGQRKNAEGKFVSAGCFHQGFFANEENLRKWVERHPLETGEAITIEQSLRDKMVLSPAQIQKACKVGECSPK